MYYFITKYIILVSTLMWYNIVKTLFEGKRLPIMTCRLQNNLFVYKSLKIFIIVPSLCIKYILQIFHSNLLSFSFGVHHFYRICEGFHDLCLLYMSMSNFNCHIHVLQLLFILASRLENMYTCFSPLCTLWVPFRDVT